MKVQTILSSKAPRVLTAPPEQSVKELVATLAQENIGVLVIVDADERPVGIVSERDIVRELAKQGAAILEQPVSAIMTRNLIIAELEDDLAYLTNTMTKKRIRHLPVMQEGRLVGMISIGDVVKAQMTHYEGEIHTLQYHLDTIYVE